MANEKRLIYANALIDSLEKWLLDAEVLCNAHVYNAIEDCICEVDSMPTVDAVEVVRCKDCKHRGSNLCPMETVELYPWFGTKNDAFCSYGERKGDGNA